MPPAALATRWARRPLALGLAAGALYAVVAVSTLLLADRPLLPLFDGLAPPPPYRWVKPPPELASSNEQPASITREAPLGPEGSPFLNVTPEDAQAVVVMEAGAVAANPPDTSVRVAVTPHDSGTLGGLPPGLTAVSNAYEVAITYQPSGAVPTLRAGVASSVALTAAGFSDVMLYSPDGASWTRRPDPEPLLGGHGLKATLEAPGYFLVTSIDRSPSGKTSPLVYVLLLGAPVVLVVVLVIVKKRRDAARAQAKADARKRGGRGPADRRSTRRPPPPGRSDRPPG